MNLVVLKVFALLVIFCGVGQPVATFRVKRSLSERRMNNLETLVALSKMKKSGLPNQDDLERRYGYETKRVSAPVVSDLQTKIALKNNIKGLAITMPIAGGKLDPWMIGRKRRSDSRFFNTLLNHHSEEENSDPLQQSYDNSLFSYSFIH